MKTHLHKIIIGVLSLIVVGLTIIVIDQSQYNDENKLLRTYIDLSVRNEIYYTMYQNSGVTRRNQYKELMKNNADVMDQISDTLNIEYSDLTLKIIEDMERIAR